jgi:nitroreductase
MATQNILLAAQALGLGACVVRSFSSAGVREIVGIPDDIELELLVALGYPVEMPEPPARKPTSEIAFRDHYGQRWGIEWKDVS